jgi:Domain of unknown function (DUF1990)
MEGLRDDRVVRLTPWIWGWQPDCAGWSLPTGEPGQTKGVLPVGYRHLRRRAVIGSGPKVFAAAATMLLGWQVHLRAGLRVSSSSATAGLGTVVVLGLRAGPLPDNRALPGRLHREQARFPGIRLRHPAQASRMRRGGVPR